MAKMRIYDIAKELSVPPKEIIDMLATIGVAGKVPSSSIEDTAARSLRQMIENRNHPQPREEPAAAPTPASFQNFRQGARRPSGTDVPADVSSDVIEDYRDYVAPDEDIVTQGPAKSGPGARRDAVAGTSLGSSTRSPVENRPVTPVAPVATSTPAAPVAPSAPAASSAENKARPTINIPANMLARQNGATSPANGAATNGAPANGAAPAAGAGTSQFQTRGRFGRGNRRDFRNSRRDGRVGEEPRFGDRDFRAETETAQSGGNNGKSIALPPQISVADLAEKLGQPVSALIKKLFAMSVIRAGNQTISSDVAGQLASQFGFTTEVETARTETHITEEDQEGLVSAAPVVTIMGHVDHGKTSLLDIIRSANVQSGEAGGITQRIGAYETEHNGERIVFLDTPGHEAFTRMRARGAHVTDIAVLVVAADDGVMPQTREAVEHARAAKVPIVVAMNKMDRPGADPDRVKGELAGMELIPEDYGGDTIVVPVSAKTGQGVQDLLDMILLVAEVQELKANPEGPAQGTIIEAQQDTQRGPLATVLIHRGTLHVGDHVVVGDVFGRVRAMTDYKGDNLQEAGPKTPVSVTGLSAVPSASETLRVVPSSRIAREQAQEAGAGMREARAIGNGKASLNELFAQIQQGATKNLNVIVKADVQGSVEAMCQSLEKLAHDEVRVRIISRGAGNVTENDVMLASASDAIVIAFSVGIENAAVGLADREGIEIREYSVIYAAIDDVKNALEGMLEPVYEERLSGEAEVRAMFKSTKAGTIAGCLVTSGKIVVGSTLRVWRKGKKVFDGKIDGLKHYKEDVKEMVAGQECGISSKGFDEFVEGDVLQSIVLESIKRDIGKGRPEAVTVGAPEPANSR